MALISPDLNVMIKAAEKAAKSLIRDFGEVEQLQVSQKGPGDFVSAADHKAEKIIFEELQKARPDYSFLMEENGFIQGKDSGKRFIIDPLDGTTNFLHGLPHWAISIALEIDGEVTAGLIFDPVKDELFTAEKNGGAFLRRKRLRVSGRKNLMISAIAHGAPKHTKDSREQFMKEFRAVQNTGATLRRYGAASLDLAYVAAGRYEGYWERDLKPWDIAAGLLIVKEAGGFVGDLDNDKTSALDTCNIIATNAESFADLKKVLRAA